MSIYTKTGDKGETGLFGGERIDKSSLRVKAYGEVDELNSFLGLASSRIEDKEISNLLKKIQNDLLVIGSDLATKFNSLVESKIRRITYDEVTHLEKHIDKFTYELNPLTKFILPSGNPGSSLLHICRTVCRRAERSVVELNKKENINPDIIKYLNRLSDLFFTLARVVNKRNNVEDEIWE